MSFSDEKSGQTGSSSYVPPPATTDYHWQQETGVAGSITSELPSTTLGPRSGSRSGSTSTAGAYEDAPPPLPRRPTGGTTTSKWEGYGDEKSQSQYQTEKQQHESFASANASYNQHQHQHPELLFSDQPPAYNPSGYSGKSAFQPGVQPGVQSGPQQFQPPPQRYRPKFEDNDNPSDPVHYIRNPHKLIGYLVPFPRPQLPNVKPEDIPVRFMIYTPPPPPLQKPADNQKEGKLHKVQRKWQEEVRSAKTSTAKTASWHGVKSKATRGINWAMNKTTTANLDFLGRVSPTPTPTTPPPASQGQSQLHSDTDGSYSESLDQGPGYENQTQTHKTVGVEEMVMVYPGSLPLNEQQMREEFVNTMLRTKTKAQRDTIIATGLMPVTYGIDILATFIWPFGGLGEIDTVWAYASFRGAKTARSVTKRLSSSTDTSDDQDRLKLTFTHSARIEVLKKYLDAQCHRADSTLFPSYTSSPTESDVLEAIGWTPSDRRGLDQEDKNWEDEQWEMSEVKEDLKSVFSKAAREWRKWCRLLEKNPEKAMKK
ncbi:hypothetical protein HRR83_001136 [Exophiala dermatitidis]|uniref:Secreted protein n=2 Tax=Exophiala dermatitidis TaxID=5970 RepID=H6C795_EXODN|nr:uncharacterized protein HMPREF1120_07576 [Exophiala dermatitidis NIH/UT8656]KAJ4522646.1 hypothetical protein HRR75_001040 [Exophiala dermatitidis]EHY59591.1 hypothetical protein HMPREF1120_07576 [Exophiala dermatitidis NIH/UT8656]KAJ4525947.1 hypothetical protein HRR74_001140 [Exophiala dermatitidis]KAJ4527106.1 hypothetical protein HRR73_001903 [Exophiala dermatitidis]KAJ4532824.1 hypothetical protein HRR76_007804 [Exophiala dermatitidis]